MTDDTVTKQGRELDAEMRVLFDVDQKRPACALLQAASDATDGIWSLFPSETWIVHPTPDMRLLVGSREEMTQLADLALKAVRADTEGDDG